MSNASTSNNKAENASVADKKEAQATKRPTDKLDVEIAEARLNQHRRLAAPMTSVPAHGLDERKMLVTDLRRKGIIPEDYVTFFGDEKKRRRYISDGYEPVRDDLTGLQAQDKLDPLFMRPKVMLDREQALASEESMRRIRGRKKEDLDKAKELGIYQVNEDPDDNSVKVGVLENG